RREGIRGARAWRALGTVDRRMLGRDQSGPPTIRQHQLPASGALRATARDEGARVVLAVLDLGVRIEVHADQVVRAVALDERLLAPAPVERQADLVYGALPDPQRGHAFGDQHLRLDRVAGGDDGRPAVRLETHLLGELRRDLAVH